MKERLESDRFPYLPLSLQVRGRSYEVDALIDTGFDGDVTLPASILDDETPDGQMRASLADSSLLSIPAYRGEVRVGPHGPFSITLLTVGDEPSVGRGITDRFRLILDHGRQVIVEA